VPDLPGFGAPGPTLADVGESGLLSRLLGGRRVETPGLLLGPGDDAAAWQPPPGMAVVLTQDALVEDVDFRRAWITPHVLGRRSLALSLSDLAAMGATPAWCLVTLCAPADTPLADVEELHNGLQEIAAEAGCPIVGGDISAITGPLVIDVVAGGVVHPDRMLRRDAGRIGDVLVVTGTLGRAAAGLRLLQAGSTPLPGSPIVAAPSSGAPKPVARATSVDAATQEPVQHAPMLVPDAIAATWRSAQLDPTPRLREGRALAAAGVRCAGDISDGLLVDAQRTAEASRCAAELWRDALPVDPELRTVFPDDWTALAIAGGEDFELLAAVPPSQLQSLLDAWPHDLAPLHIIGRLVDGAGITLLDRDGGTPLDLPPVASRHFGS
jgi:thiamine-monophosphate kinase